MISHWSSAHSSPTVRCSVKEAATAVVAGRILRPLHFVNPTPQVRTRRESCQAELRYAGARTR